MVPPGRFGALKLILIVAWQAVIGGARWLVNTILGRPTG